MRCPTLAELPPPPESMTVWPWTRESVPLPPAMPDGRAWPSISIVMPSLNQAPYLEEALRSVLLQGYPALELIVMDGGSSDGSVAILERYGGWLAHWSSGRDAGPAAALNSGFLRAGGEILGVLNADDFYLPGGLADVARAFAARPEADVVSGHGYFATATGRLGARAFSDCWHPARFRHGACVLLQQSTFFRRAAFERAGGFRENDRVCWDMELWADLAAAGARFDTMDAFVAAFRLHGGSITGRADQRARRRLDARQVMAEAAGHAESNADRWAHVLHRALKFSRHPARTLRQRWFFYTTLGRWSL